MVRADRHRGPHPKDAVSFDAHGMATIRSAASDLAWLLDRGYGRKPSLALVSDRYALRDRQRQALQRAVDPIEPVEARRTRRTDPAGQRVIVDGFNVVIVTEAGLGGAPLVRGRDGQLRNLAVTHRGYRLVAETEAACRLLLAALTETREAIWYLDRGMANSGRLAAVLRSLGAVVSCRDRVDALVAEKSRMDGWVAATADTGILDRAGASTDLPAAALAGRSDIWTIDLEGGQNPK